jgi:predicted Zn finger-like uncharacterized protein
VIVRCTDCSTKYEIAASKIPQEGVNVRCPKCKAVFPVVPSQAPEPVSMAMAPKASSPVEPAAAAVKPSDFPSEPKFPSAPRQHAESKMETPTMERPVMESPAMESPSGGRPTLGTVPGGFGSPSLQPPRRGITDPTIARRMARAVVQEVLLARQQEHYQALIDGSVLKGFGGDIADAFDLYESKVSGDLPERKTIFLEAVNDVLGNGQRLL